jgi:adenylate cyclase
MPPLPLSFDGPLGQKIIELHMWAVGEGCVAPTRQALFDGLCRRLIDAGVPLWRAFAGMRTLHPQWGGYGYTWWRRLNAIQPTQFERGDEYEQGVTKQPYRHLDPPRRGAGGDGLGRKRRIRGCICAGAHRSRAQLDFPQLEELAAAGATDYFAEVVRFGADGDPSRGTGVGYSFATDRASGFGDDDIVLLKAVLPVVSLAMMTDAGYTIASGLLGAYLGADAGRRVHAGQSIAARSRASEPSCGSPISAPLPRLQTRHREQR